MEGATIGSYVVLRLLGKGGMGEVYLAEHALLKRTAALKVLLPSLSADEELVERFFNEARATTSIPDPGIVQIFDFGHHTDGSAYIVMEYLEGETLDARLDRDGAYPVVSALRIARQVATSLHAAHTRGVVHRDLKLENVFLVADAAIPGGERAKILDFGIAKLARNDGSRSRTRTGAIMGTPIYMSPEQCKGAHDVDGRSDVYSLGCMLFCLLSGRPPFDYESAGEIIAAHLREEPPRVASILAEVPPALDELIARCLAKDPAARWATMAEVAAAIGAILGDEELDPRTSQPRLSGGRAAMATPLPRLATPAPGAGAAPLGSSPTIARPTTLSSATGSSPVVAPPRGRRWLLIGAGALAVGAAAFVAVSQVGGKPAHRDPSAPAAQPSRPATPTPAAPTPSPPPAAAAPAPIDELPPTPVAVEPELALPAVPAVAPLVPPRDRPKKPATTRPAKPVKPAKKPLKGSHATKPSTGVGDVDRGD